MDPFRLARHFAPKSNNKCFRHVAVVVRGGAIVAVGYNHDSIHAEVQALNKLWPSERKGTKVWSLRLNRSGHFRCAKPCPNCARYLKESGVKAVYYTNRDGDIVGEKI